MDTLNLKSADPSGLDLFLHRNTKTEISNFEGSFRPGIFSRIESSSSFDSSFENITENYSELIKEQRPLSKSYKPESVLKASFLTEERNSPSFREFEGSKQENTEIPNKELTHEFPKDFFKFNEGNPYFFSEKEKNLPFENNFLNVPKKEELLPEEKNKEKSGVDHAYLKLIEIITDKDKEIKELKEKIRKKEAENGDFMKNLKDLEEIVAGLEKENKSLKAKYEKVMEKLEKSENQLMSARNAHFELQKEGRRLSARGSNEDRIRRVAEDPPRPKKTDEKLKEIVLENEALKQELQKRPSPSQYQNVLSRIEELEGMLSKRSNKKLENFDKNENFVLNQIKEHLKIEDHSEIINTIKKIQNSRKDSKLVARISELIIDCVPPGTFKHGPSHRDIWKFIRNIMEKYIALKKNDGNVLIEKLQGLLGLSENGNVYQEILKIYHALNFMELVFDKVKSKLGLLPHSTLKEVESALEDL